MIHTRHACCWDGAHTQYHCPVAVLTFPWAQGTSFPSSCTVIRCSPKHATILIGWSLRDLPHWLCAIPNSAISQASSDSCLFAFGSPAQTPRVLLPSYQVLLWGTGGQAHPDPSLSRQPFLISDAQKEWLRSVSFSSQKT